MAAFLVPLLISLAVSAVSMLLMPRPKQENAQAGQLDGPTAQEGKPIPVVYGTVMVKNVNIVDWFNPGTIEIRSSGGKK